MKKLYVVLILAISLLSMAFINNAAQDSIHQPQQELAAQVKDVLIKYSASLSANSDQVADEVTISPEVKKLISNRISFYKEYVSKGLMLKDPSISSEFQMNSIKIEDKGDVINVDTYETIVLSAKTQIQSADEYPSVKAYSWAMDNVSSQDVIDILTERKQELVKSVNDSISEGVQLPIILQHKMEFKYNEEKVLVLVGDSFTDDTPEIKGIENVVWQDNTFTRKAIDFSAMPEAVIFNTPIEAAGKEILDVFSTKSASTSSATSYYYSHSNAVSYVRFIDIISI